MRTAQGLQGTISGPPSLGALENTFQPKLLTRVSCATYSNNVFLELLSTLSADDKCGKLNPLSRFVHTACIPSGFRLCTSLESRRHTVLTIVDCRPTAENLPRTKHVTRSLRIPPDRVDCFRDLGGGILSRLEERLSSSGIFSGLDLRTNHFGWQIVGRSCRGTTQNSAGRGQQLASRYAIPPLDINQPYLLRARNTTTPRNAIRSKLLHSFSAGSYS